MRHLKFFNRFRQYLWRSQQKSSPEKLRFQLRLEELEGRLVLSTLSISTGEQVVFSGNSSLSSENLTLSEKIVPTIFGNIAERTFTDPNDTINVTGPGAGQCSGSGTHTVTWATFEGVGSIDVFTNAFSTDVSVQANDIGILVTEGSGKNLAVNLESSSNGVQSILAPVGIDQQINTATNVTVDDSTDSGKITNATFNGGYLTGLAPAAIHVGGNIAGALNLNILGGRGLAPFANTFTITGTPINNSIESSSVTLNTGANGAEVNVQGTSGPLNIDNTGGFDSVTIGSTAPKFGGTLANIFGAVDVYGTGSTSLYIDDSGDTSGHTATLTGTSLTGLSPAAIKWAPSAAATGGVTFLSIDGSAASSTYYVNNTPNLHYNTDLSTGHGNDIVNIAGTTSPLDVYNYGGQDSVYVGNGTLAGINGNVSVSGAGSTYLYVLDGSDTTAHTAPLNAFDLSGLSKGTIFWSASSAPTGGVTYLDIIGSAAGSTYSITNTPNFYYYTFLETGTGSDDVFVSGTTGKLYVYNSGSLDADYVTGNGTLSTINGLVYFYGAGPSYLYVEDIYDTTARTATLTSTSLTGLSPAPIEWTASSSPSGGGVTSLVFYGSSTASDIYDVASIPSFYYGTDLLGGNGTNTLIGPNTTNTWSITGADAGNLNGNLGFSGMAHLVGGTGVDTFRFTAAASQVANIDGGGAPAGQGDWLDYTSFLSAVTVNLATGKATGVTGTVKNIQNVFGGNNGATLIGDSQGNILIGGAGADTILGGTGLGLLIGGAGNDTVTGGSGGDILIGSSTTYDQSHNEDALMSILAEWQSGKSYAQRVNDLKFGGGLNGSNTLVLGKTVLDDGGSDSLTGGNHIPGALDWFFAGVHDTIHNYESGEQIN